MHFRAFHQDVPLHTASQSKHYLKRELAGSSKSMYHLSNYMVSYDKTVILTVILYNLVFPKFFSFQAPFGLTNNHGSSHPCSDK